MTIMTTIEILFHDQDLIAINKPAGLLTIQDGYDRTRPNLHQELSKEYGRLWVVHRLDMDTSGVLLFARNPAAHRDLNIQFEHHSVNKIYHLLTLGSLDWKEQRVNLPLRIDGDRRHRTIIDPRAGKPAVTDFQVVERFDDHFALIAATPHSGYTHQIRAHCAALSLWLLADPLYFPRLYPPQPGTKLLHRKELFDQVSEMQIDRTALHACSLYFIHPTTREELTISAPYPEDFAATISLLRAQK